MGTAIVAVIGSLLGVVIGVIGQQVQASRAHQWRQEDILRDTKRLVYSKFLSSIDVSYAQATSGQETDLGFTNMLGATAEIEMLSKPQISEFARSLATVVVDVHSAIKENHDNEPMLSQIKDELVPQVDHQRYALIDLFKADIGTKDGRHTLPSTL